MSIKTSFVYNDIKVEMTMEQMMALFQQLPSRGWTPDYATVHRMPADTCIGVVCKTNSGMSMFFGIEEDGYCHT
jgi:hypothetical protein